MKSYKEYIYGDKEYAKLLEVLRAHLCHEFDMKYGGIIFCRYNPEKEYPLSNKVKVFPINPAIIDEHFPNDDEIRNEYLEAINRERSIEELYYIRSLRTKSISAEHLEFQAEDTLNFNTKMINRLSWNSYFKSLTPDTINILDQLFFSSKEFRFKAIPIPILSTPVIILVVPQNIQIDVDKIYKTVSESVQLYLFNKLINEINTDVTNEISRIKDEASFIKKFVDVFSEVTIPIKYTVDQEDFFCFDWYGNFDSEKALKFDLKLKSKSVTFFNPTFCWFDGLMVENRDYYRVKENQFKETIESIYKLIHKNWEAVREVEIRALAAYKKTITEAAINPIIIKGVIEQMQSVNDTLEKALKMNIDDFSQTLNTVITNRVAFELITENPNNEYAYRIIVNGNHIKSYNKRVPHFGYKIFKEIIENAKNGVNQLYFEDFTFIEDIKLSLRNNTRNNITTNNKYANNDSFNSEDIYDSSTLNNSQTRSLSDPFANIICSLPYPDNNLEEPEKDEKIKLMKRFKSDIINSDQPVIYLATYLKPYTDAFYTYRSINDNDPTAWSKFVNRLNFLNEIKREIKTRVSNYDTLYSQAESLPLNELAIKRRELFNRNPDADRHVKTKIYNNLESVIGFLRNIDEVKDLFSDHFDKSRLTPFDRSSNKLIYDVSDIDSTLTVEWIFI